jgi:hypothetical protein
MSTTYVHTIQTNTIYGILEKRRNVIYHKQLVATDKSHGGLTMCGSHLFSVKPSLCGCIYLNSRQ